MLQFHFAYHRSHADYPALLWRDSSIWASAAVGPTMHLSPPHLFKESKLKIEKEIHHILIIKKFNFFFNY
jgi:hypothetical protein